LREVLSLVQRRGLFGTNMEVVTGELSKLQREELHDTYCSPDFIWINKLIKI
jgi:hypothetical protein